MKRLLLSFASAFALTQAQAQAPSPAQLGITPTTTPEVLQVLEPNSKTWVPVGYLNQTSKTFLGWLASNLDPRTYGAKCDGTTDDTTALQAWAAATTANARMFVPGICVFKSQLAFPQVYGVTIIGDGHPGELLYSGTSTTLNPIIQIGQPNASSGCAVAGWAIKGLRVMSNTAMTAGDGLQIADACNMVITDLTVGGNLDSGNKNFFNALHFNGGNSVFVRGFGVQGSSNGMMVNGDPTSGYQFTDLMLLQGYIVHSLVGLHICGGMGGLEADQTDTLENGTNVLIDRTCANTANLQMYFGSAFASDATAGSEYPSAPQIGVHVSDPGSPYFIITYKGWMASATNQCFLWDAGTPDAPINPTYPPQVYFIGTTFKGCHAPSGSHGMVENQNIYAHVSISGANFSSNPASVPTIFNASGGVPVVISGVDAGDINFNISGPWGGSYIDSNKVIQSAQFNGVTANYFVSNGGSAAYQWRGVGGTQPANSTNWDMVVTSNTGDMALRTLNDAYTASTPYVDFLRGTGYQLSGARMVVNVPLQVSGYSIATLPTCNATQMQGAVTYVNNAQASPPYLGIVSTTGSIIAPVFCNGTNWVYH